MKIALAQINPTIGDFALNTEKMLRFVEKAKGLSCDLVIFSELVISGYPPRDLLERQDFVAANLDKLETLIGQLQDRAAEIVSLQYRARVIWDQHEPPVE